MHQLHKDTVLSLLTTRGWVPEAGTAIASKTYATAVGPKQAHAYLADFGPSSAHLCLTGDYRSEGRNILESRGQLLPKVAAPLEVEALACKFADAVDASVGESYAARLLRIPD